VAAALPPSYRKGPRPMPGDPKECRLGRSRPHSTIEDYVSGTVQERDLLGVMTSRVDMPLKGQCGDVIAAFRTATENRRAILERGDEHE
jgi:hypothetical protein